MTDDSLSLCRCSAPPPFLSRSRPRETLQPHGATCQVRQSGSCKGQPLHDPDISTTVLRQLFFSPPARSDRKVQHVFRSLLAGVAGTDLRGMRSERCTCLLYTSDAADDM
eukprot:4894635-Alexandrium_andersonii.AAC.1